MAEYSRPGTYLDKLLFAQRVIKAAQFRADHKQAMREMCEGLSELLTALLDREQGREASANSGQKPVP